MGQIVLDLKTFLKAAFPFLLAVTMSILSAAGTQAFALCVLQLLDIGPGGSDVWISWVIGAAFSGIVILEIRGDMIQHKESLHLLLMGKSPLARRKLIPFSITRVMFQVTTVVGGLLLLLMSFDQKKRENSAEANKVAAYEKQIVALDESISRKRVQIDRYVQLDLIQLRAKPIEREVDSLNIVRDSLLAMQTSETLSQAQRADLGRSFDVMSTQFGIPASMGMLSFSLLLFCCFESGAHSGWRNFFEMVITVGQPTFEPRGNDAGRSNKVDRIAEKFSVNLDEPNETTAQIMYLLQNTDESMRSISRKVGKSLEWVRKVNNSMKARAEYEQFEIEGE